MTDLVFTKTPVVKEQAGMRIVNLWESESFALTASGGATPSGEGAINVLGHSGFVVQLDNSGGASTNLDFEVYESLDGGTTYANEAFASINVGAGKVKGASISGCPTNLKLKATNKDATNACAAVKIRVIGIV